LVYFRTLETNEEEATMAFEAEYLDAGFMLGVDAYVPLLTNWFELRINNLGGDSYASFSNSIKLATSDISEFSVSYNEITVHYGNGYVKYPSKAAYTGVTLSLNCYCEPDILAEVELWHKQVQDAKTGARGVPSQYMKNIYVSRHDGTRNANSVKSVMKWIGCWPNKIAFGNYNQQGDDIVKITIDITISKYELLDRSAFGA
jgi:hypothetical protein